MLRKIRLLGYLLAFSLLASMLLTGCATQKASPFVKAGDLSMKMKSGKYSQNADNFEIIVDKTGSMGSDYTGVQKFAIEKSLVTKFNSYIPDLSLNAGLRTLGQNYVDFDVTKLEYGIGKYDPESLHGVIQNLRNPFGESPLGMAISAAGNDLKGLQGKSALIIFSDGVDMGDETVKAATNVKSEYGDRLCIYTVLIGNDENGAKVLNQVARAGQCGVSVKGDDLADDAAMSNFVERIFLTTKMAKAPAPAPTPVPQPEKEMKKAAEVEKKILEKGRATLDVEFDTGKSVVKPKYYNTIKSVADVMKKNPDLKIVIEGHTDNVGGEKYNLNLSQKRAEAVKDVLVKKFNIDPSRLTAKGFGESKPIASNKTKEG
ncbi:MAG TPA: OmpA family protein, partial [Syntrophales bacterium]|nr:OmpA family protein [Syntrophales bacterium]